MKEDKKIEQRKYIRFDVQTRVNFRVKQKKEGEAPTARVSGLSKNISAEGICIKSETQLRPGSKLELEIFLPAESKPLHLKGEVRWSRPLGSGEGKPVFATGVKLFTIDKSDENRFVGYVCDKMTENLSRYLHL